MSNKIQLSGYVLHKRPYRETSMLVDFFTLEQGLIRAVARSARGNTKSDRKSLLQALQKTEFELSGRSNLKTLGRIEACQQSIKLSHYSLYCVFYLNEILSRVLPEIEPVPELFSQYESSIQALDKLNQAGSSDSLKVFEPILRDFEFALLQQLGYLPDFLYDADSGEEIQANKHYVFDSQIGFTPYDDSYLTQYGNEASVNIGSEAYSDKRADSHTGHRQKSPSLKVYSGSTILNIAHSQYETENRELVLRSAKHITRLCLNELLGTKPIKSRELFLLHQSG